MSRNFELLSRPFPAETSPTIAPKIVDGSSRRRMPGPGTSPSQPDLLPALRILRKHWRWSTAFAVTIVACVTSFVLFEKPTYEPVAVIQLDSSDQVVSLQATESHADPSAYADTLAKNLQGRELAVEVIRKLRLAENAQWLGSIPKSGGSPQPATAQSSSGPVLSSAEYAALGRFVKSLKVQRDGTSWLIKVSFAAHDPGLAALIANTLVESFIQREYQSRSDAITQSTDWLSRQLDDIRLRMNESNRALADFQESSGITAAGNSVNSFDERMSELNRQLTLAQADRIQLEALLAKTSGSIPDSVAQVSADPAVQELTKKLDTARADLKEALVVFGPNHPKAKQLKAQVDELQAGLKAQQNRVLSNIKTSFAAANAREALLNSELKNASTHLGQVARYEALKKTAEANEALYTSLYAKVKEAAISAEAKNSNIRWVEHAPVLDRPTYPRRMLDIAAALAAGLIGGILLAFARESLDNRVHTLDDVRFSTGLASVSLVPLITEGNGSAAHGHNRLFASRPFLMQRPNSPEAEALRGIFTSVTLSLPGREPQVLLVASSAPGEGKTTIAANLAVALARTRRTCIVDADLRKPALTKVFGVEHPHGLAEVLCEAAELDIALVPVPGIPNLTLLPVGPVSGSAAELLTAENMARVLQDLRQQFDAVIVDSPPIMPYADARAISPLVDGVIIVGRSGLTTRESIKRSMELLREVHSAPVLDVVLNAVPHSSPDYSYHHGYAAS